MQAYVILDIFLLTTSFAIIKINCKLSFYHPATWLLVFHFFTNTLRFLAVANGAELAFSDFKIIEGASEEELMRAIFWSDIALLVSSLFIVVAENYKERRLIKVKETKPNAIIIKRVLLVTIPLGIWGALTQLTIPTVILENENIANTSGYTTIIQSWFGLSMLILVYFDGFKKKYIIPLLIYLFLIAIQGYHRYRLVLPIVFLIATYLSQKELSWPTRSQLIVLLALSIAFFPLKSIGKVIQAGGSIEEVSEIFSTSFAETTSGSSGDQSFLDQFAMTLTQIDKHGEIYLGSTILPIFVSPIPRIIWENKPVLNQWQDDISTNSRPFSTMGAISTIYGESYANFRYIGLILLPALLFYFLTRWYKRILLVNKRSIEFLMYLLVLSCLIQVLRDGFISLFLFPVVNSLPIFLVILIHKLFKKADVKIIRV